MRSNVGWDKRGFASAGPPSFCRPQKKLETLCVSAFLQVAINRLQCPFSNLFVIDNQRTNQLRILFEGSDQALRNVANLRLAIIRCDVASRECSESADRRSGRPLPTGGLPAGDRIAFLPASLNRGGDS